VLLAAAVSDGCKGEIGGAILTGRVSVTIIGLGPEVTTAGRVVITSVDVPDFEEIIIEALPVIEAAEVEVQAGTWHVEYTPPDGYGVVADSSGSFDVTVIAGQTTPVSVTITNVVGFLAVNVTGLDTSAPNGGTAEIAIGGTLVATLNIPVSGSAQRSLVPGAYQVTYRAPSGFRLVAGQANPRPVTVLENQTVSETYAVEIRPPGTVLFHSDWSTDLGSTETAMLDTGQPIAWDEVIGNGRLVVVSSAGLNFPSSHVLQVDGVRRGTPPPSTVARQVGVTPLRNRWPIPEVGESLFFRLYKHFVYPANYPNLGNNNHPIGDRPGTSNWAWCFHSSSQGWQPRFQSQSTPAYYVLSNGTAPIYLARGTTYRLEWQIHRIGLLAFNAHIQIFDGSAVNPLYTDDDFYHVSGSGVRLTDNPPLTLAVENLLQGLIVGTNGPSGETGEDVIPMWYIGCVAVRADGWCGPYEDGI
jgi:hypothetical protein